MKKALLLFSLFYTIGCSTPGTHFVQAKKFGQDGFTVIDSPKHPGHGVAIFQANKDTKPTLAVAYTVLAAHQACLRKDKVSVVLPPQFFPEERRYASSYQCEKKIKLIQHLPKQLQEVPEGLQVLDEFTTLPFLENDIILGFKLTSLYHKANTSKLDKIKLNIERDGKKKSIQVKLLDKTEQYRKIRLSDIQFICKTIQEEGIKVASKEYPKACAP